jgi:hypothetical protein
MLLEEGLPHAMVGEPQEKAEPRKLPAPKRKGRKEGKSKEEDG